MHEIAQAAHLEDQPCGTPLAFDPADPVLGEFTLSMREDGRLMLKSGPIEVVEPDEAGCAAVNPRQG